MNRFSQKRGDHIEYAAWLVADRQGGLKLVRGQPDTGQGEVGVALIVRVPVSLFRKPLLRAEVTVPPQAGVTEADAIRAIATLIETGSDFEVEVTARAPEAA